jgi:hypothetical protein
MVNTLASTVKHRGNKIGARDRQIEANPTAIAECTRIVKNAVQRSKDLERDWRAYLKRVPPQ